MEGNCTKLIFCVDPRPRSVRFTVSFYIFRRERDGVNRDLPQRGGPLAAVGPTTTSTQPEVGSSPATRGYAASRR